RFTNTLTIGGLTMLIKQSSFHMPSVNLFGEGTIDEVGIRLKNLGVKKPLLVTDEGLHKLGLSEQIAEIVRNAGLEIAIFPKAEINTTAGTGSELTKFTIITDSERKVKMAIIDKHVTPTLSVNDPNLMKGMPPSLTAATGLDALTHAIEAYVSTDATPITDALAIH